MMFDALLAAAAIAAISVIGALFFGQAAGRLQGTQRFVVPMAVGVFLSLILNELIPETLAQAPEWGGSMVAVGFVSFYVLAHALHRRFHHLEADDCDRKGAALLLLVGDGIHNVSDGVIIGSAFLLDPTVGVATAIGLALHEVPQEIVEFGVLIRAGFSRTRAALLNLLSASSILIGVAAIVVAAEYAADYVWVITGLAAGNLLFLAASDLLPRIHGNLRHYGSIWNSALAIILGFILMTGILILTPEQSGHSIDDSQVEDAAGEPR
tara:strand:+ start:1264 stop:2064 length:801 start_codon:yes stop_codon:yes gene_type:complete